MDKVANGRENKSKIGKTEAEAKKKKKNAEGSREAVTKDYSDPQREIPMN